MDRALARTWWLLVLCGILDAMHAAMNVVMIDPTLALRRFGLPGAVQDMGMLALAAGACAIAVGLWSAGKNSSWLLSVHGLALGAFGVVAASPLVKGPLSFRPVSLLFFVMAASIGAFALCQPRGAPAKSFLNAAGAASIGFALSFVAVGFDLVKLRPPYAFFVWMSSYFAFCAIFMLWLAIRVRGRESGQTGPFSPAPRLRPAH